MNFEKRVLHIKKHLNKIDILFDIGPGRANTEAFYFKKFFSKIQIFGFEPSNKRYNKLKNNYPGSLQNVAVSDFSGIKMGYETTCPNPKDRTFNFIKDIEHNNFEVKINTITLDEFYSTLKSCNNIFIWADVDGSEYKILKGAEKLLSEKKIVGIELELNNYPWIPSYKTAVNYLEKLGYVSIEPNKLNVPFHSHKDCTFVRK